MTTTTGSVVWFDFPVKDFEKSTSFYAELFGWTCEKFKETPKGKYCHVRNETGYIGGLLEYPKEGSPGLNGIIYFAVPNIDDVLEKTIALGGKIHIEKSAVPDSGGAYAQIIDLSGNIIGIWSDGK